LTSDRDGHATRRGRPVRRVDQAVRHECVVEARLGGLSGGHGVHEGPISLDVGPHGQADLVVA
jgi:hypothetical protein